MNDEKKINGNTKKTYLLIDSSYVSFHRFFSTLIWYNNIYQKEEDDDYDLEGNLVVSEPTTFRLRQRQKPHQDNRSMYAVFTPADLAHVNAKTGSFVFTNAAGESVHLTKKVVKNNMYWGAL